MPGWHDKFVFSSVRVVLLGVSMQFQGRLVDPP